MISFPKLKLIDLRNCASDLDNNKITDFKALRKVNAPGLHDLRISKQLLTEMAT